MLTGDRNPETALVIVAVLLAVAAAHFRFRFFGCWERPLARLARRKTLAVWIAALSPLALRALLLPWFPAPEPRYHDEFTFLLGADTFAHGRLVNPPHPLWVHFESEHILVRPVYTTVFPIAQAAALALGKVVVGHPWAGVWLGMAFMCGALCWMLQAWVPPRWALLGALLVALRFGVASYWMNTYWGGCLAAAGGALVLGAWPRALSNGTTRAPAWRPAVILGLGLAILANTRTFEGAALGLAVAVPLITALFQQRALLRFLLPLALVLAATGAGMGFYFARVTGKPWLAPYVLYRDSMSMAPHFLWQKPTPEPLYNNRDLREFYVNWELNSYLSARNHPLFDLWNKLETYWRFYVGPLLTLPLLAVPLLWKKRKLRNLFWISAAFLLSLVGQVWHNPHYAAPAAGLVILIVVLGMRRLRLWRWRELRLGLNLVRILPWACAAMLALRIAAGPPPPGSVEEASWRWPSQAGAKRENVLRQLESLGGKHLVLIRYARAHDPGDEWVYNGADIDASRVVWARELDAADNQKLLRYFAGRSVWLVEPDADQPRAVPYRDAPSRLMPFVQLGAPGIAVLQPESVRRAVGGGAPANCDVWNYAFAQATGVQGPGADRGCYPESHREAPVTFEHWFSWLRQQR